MQDSVTWEAMAELRWALLRTTAEQDTNSYFEYILRVLRNVHQYQIDMLGVWCGGFWFFDPSSREVIPIHRTDEDDAPAALQSFPFPYAWRKPPGADIEKLIDAMWYIWRRWDSIQGPWDERHWPPEYYVDLPSQPSTKSVDEIGRFWAESTCHYCPYGEILFHLLSWRLALRTAQLDGWDGNPMACVAEIAGSCRSGEDSCGLWTESFWGNGESRERQWYDFVTSTGADADVQAAWRTLSTKTGDEKGDDSTWARDWLTLGLPLHFGTTDVTNQNGSGLAPSALLAYCRDMVIQSSRRERTPKAAETMLDVFLKAFEEVFLDSEANSPQPLSARVLLERVHLRARFPVLPYFYWLAVDPAPRAHLVIPVWSTTSDVVVVPKRDPRRKGAMDLSRANGSTRSTNVVGVATIGVTPFEGADLTLATSRADTTAAGERLDLIRSFYELLARPVVDFYFYRRQKERENLAYREAEAAVLQDVTHRLRNLTAGLAGVLDGVRVGELVYKKPPAELLDEVVTEVQKNLHLLGRYADRLDELSSVDAPTDFELAEFVTMFSSAFERDYHIKASVTIRASCSITIHGRRTSLWWAFDELSYNAIKSMKRAKQREPELVITVSVSPETRRLMQRGVHGWVCVELADNGIAISEADAQRAFEKGFSRTGGTGYGLPRVQRIVEREFDGSVTIQSSPTGIGTTVKIEVPAIFAQEAHR